LTLLVAIAFGGALSVHAQNTNSPGTIISGGDLTDLPSFQPLAARKWEMGPFVNYGNGVGDRSDYHFFALGFQLSRSMFPVVHAGPLSGRFEFGGNIMPLWQAYTPSPHTQVVDTGDGEITQQIGGGTFTGLSITPVVFRWNFAPDSRRWTPWFQAQGAVLYTTHKFPPTVEVPEGTPGGTSVFNFRSGAGIGVHYFTRPRRSLDFALNAEHISSASLGDKNPGVNASLQFQLGYSWWK
jgi:lipid A 3-O-deacylase